MSPSIQIYIDLAAPKESRIKSTIPPLHKSEWAALYLHLSDVHMDQMKPVAPCDGCVYWNNPDCKLRKKFYADNPDATVEDDPCKHLSRYMRVVPLDPAKPKKRRPILTPKSKKKKPKKKVGGTKK